MCDPIDVIVVFEMPKEDKNRDKNYPMRYSTTMAKVKPVRFRYNDTAINVDKILRRYEEKINGEKVLGYRCFYRERGFYYHLLFFTQQCKWFIKFEKQ